MVRGPVDGIKRELVIVSGLTGPGFAIELFTSGRIIDPRKDYGGGDEGVGGMPAKRATEML